MMRKLQIWVVLGVVISLGVMRASAQTPAPVTNAAITYAVPVEDTITANAIYDWWSFAGTPGEAITITMIASDGLAPLVGLLNASGDLIARSDAQPDGSLLDAAVDSTATLTFTLPAPEEYTIIATRVGNENGTTTGSYALRMDVDESAAPPVKDLQDVVFNCDQTEIVTAATVEMWMDAESEGNFTISVYGLDGFQPYIRIDIPLNEGVTDCSSRGDELVGDAFTLADVTEITVLEGSPANARHVLENMAEFGNLTLIIGSRDGAPGRYVVLIEGFSIQPAADVDDFNFRLGPRARDTSMLVYMLRAPNSRIDPQMRAFSRDPALDFQCDDAGQRACADLPSAEAYQFTLDSTRDTARVITGDRFDAGVQIATGSPNRVGVRFSSRTETTSGAYTILMLGELPPPPQPGG
ncbi:MAG: hypothetical protein H7Y11_12280 [Armatimonadetes bacterium]|nr:hypothetical protein [Anaerolineae bacterium]